MGAPFLNNCCFWFLILPYRTFWSDILLHARCHAGGLWVDNPPLEKKSTVVTQSFLFK